MKKSLRGSITRRFSHYAAVLAIGATSTSAIAGELVHQLEVVSTPPQNVCRGQGCAVNTESYAWHKTQWRRWPGTPTVLPSPGRADRAEAVPPRAQFDMPDPGPATMPAGPRTQGTGIRTPRPAPRTPTRAAPPSATSAPAVPDSNDSMPPIDLDEILRNDDEPSPPATMPEPTTPVDEIPPPFDSKRSGGAPPRDNNRTLNALTAGLNGGRAKPQAAAPADPWKAAPVRKVNGEKSAPEGPMLNEPNLMSAPDDGPQLQATPDGDNTSSLWTPVNSANEDGNVTPVANWEDSATAAPETAGGNPLRASTGSEGRRANPLRRR
jgi:hypothetical protein